MISRSNQYPIAEAESNADKIILETVPRVPTDRRSLLSVEPGQRSRAGQGTKSRLTAEGLTN